MFVQTQKIFEEARRELGFDLLSLVPIESTPHFDFFKNWLREGHAAGMHYLEKRADLRADVRAFFPEARSVVMAALVYKQSAQSVEAFSKTRGFSLAQYAWGREYHAVFRDKLSSLGERLRAQALLAGDETFDYRVFVDTAPVLERDIAALAGLGWIGKNTCLIHPQKGSYLFLGGLAITASTQDRPSPRIDHCGTCRACLDACPTGALTAPYTLDARRCIAYWTIEHRGDFPDPIREEAKAEWKGWVFGCDLCQAVCPWNRKSPAGTHAEFALLPAWEQIENLADLLAITPAQWSAFRESPVRRTKWSGLKRNAEALLGDGISWNLPKLPRS